MMILLSLVLGAVAGVAFAVWRLRGARSVAETAKVVIMGGGGPGEEP